MYKVDVDSLICFVLGVIGLIFLLVFFSRIFNCLESGRDPERYALCKRCKYLIKKDKIFCLSCRDNIKMSLKRDKDKKYFNEYKTLIKKEKKK